MCGHPLIRAIYDDDSPGVKRLLKKDPSLARFSFEEPKLFWGKISHWIYAGDTPLHLAAAGSRVEIVRQLIAAGADPNSALNHRRSGPLHYAADGCPGRANWNPDRQLESIHCLLDAGADMNAPDKNGATPLHRAVRTRCAAAVKCLLEAGADPKLKNKPGSTAFHLAVQNTGRGCSGLEAAKAGQSEIIRTLLDFGLSVNLKDGKGKSVADCAVSDGVREMLGC